MSELLWQKEDESVDKNIMQFTAGDDVILDRELFLHDINATRAHVLGLTSIEILNGKENDAICLSLDELAQQFVANEFVLDDRFEDGHSAIEWYLTEKLGDIGKKVHTGRSRNDQVLVATRLYMREALLKLRSHCLDSAESFIKKAKHFEFVPMPGYTHLQHGTVSSIGLWLSSFAEGFLDNVELADSTYEWININPLGTTAGYGVNLPLNRDLCTRALGFSRTQLNAMYVQNSRGKFELQTLMSFALALQDVRRFAWDLSLFTSAEFGFVKLPDEFTTGSSFMPNKRNPDVVELLRATVSRIFADMTEIQNLLSLPSGYHRDLQNTKRPLLQSVSKANQALLLVPRLVENLQFDTQKMSAGLEPDMYTADKAIQLSQQGMPFRDAYKLALDANLSQTSPLDSLQGRVSEGGPGNLRLDLLEKRHLELTKR